MNEFMMNTSSDTTIEVRDKELTLKVAAAASSNTTTVTKDIAVNTVTNTTSVSTEEAAAADESAAVDQEVASEEATIELPTEEFITDINVSDGVVAEPVPVFEGMPGGDIGFDDGMYMDPTMETGMAEVKDPLLSSWPFVIGISVAVLLVSMTLGALLARRKIKKGIELYED